MEMIRLLYQKSQAYEDWSWCSPVSGWECSLLLQVSRPFPLRWSTTHICRHHHHIYPRPGHIVLIRLALPSFLARNIVHNCQCSMSAYQWETHRHLRSKGRTSLLKRLLWRRQSPVWPGTNRMGHDRWKSHCGHGWWRHYDYQYVRDIRPCPTAKARTMAGIWQPLLRSWCWSRWHFWWMVSNTFNSSRRHRSKFPPFKTRSSSLLS